MKKTILTILAAAVITAVFACGSGGGGGGGGNNNPGNGGSPGNSTPSTAIVKLSAAGTSSQIGGIDVTIELPAGVTVKSTANPPETDLGVVVASGQAASNSLVEATYKVVSGSSPAAVRLILLNANGFGPGEFVTITCDVAAGTSVAASDFIVKSSTISDVSGTPLTGATVSAGMTLLAGTPSAAAATVKLSISGTSTQISGIDVTVALPAGVTVKSTVNPPETDPGVVVASGQAASNSLVEATYTAASGGSQAKVRIVLVNGNTNGFTAGEFATITCDLASGAKPASSDFTILSVTAGDTSGNPIAGASASLSVGL